jgi:hypothetical protein
VLTLAYPTRIRPRSFYKPVTGVAFCEAGFQNSFEKARPAETRSDPIRDKRPSETLVSEKPGSDSEKRLAM